jgi:2-amino-4-hydroxy-6-hydroxymethyldihydropteridine diphosphokinase
MSFCLLALGSNLGDRAATLRAALAALKQLPRTWLVARSRWHETAPAGGPAGQGPFLNGAALLATGLEPLELLGELQRIEHQLGRRRDQRWGARTLDLDLLLVDRLTLRSAALELPHPRMAVRRFVLAPAAEAAPWLVHAESGWVVADLWRHWQRPVDTYAVAAADGTRAAALAAELAARLNLPPVAGPGGSQAPRVVAWSPERAAAGGTTMILAAAGSGGVDARQMRKMLHLPERGPVAWIADGADALEEALAAIGAAAR